jgi:flavin-dependent dehydrogenase
MRSSAGALTVSRSYDVVVVGCGPAGAATALRLAMAGLVVAVLERSRFDQPRAGETLSPGVQPLLRELGVWDRFLALRPLHSWGTRSVWDEPEPAEHSHLTNRYACGWHVDRRAFDRMLAEAAAGAGAHVRTGSFVADCRHDGTGWELACSDGRVLRAHVLIDASGRRAGPGRSLQARRLVFDRLVAVATGWTEVDVSKEQYLLVEAVADGWWYTAPLPEDGMVSMLMTDVDLCRQGKLPAATQWRARLHAANLTAARVGARSPVSAPRVYPAASHRLIRSGDTRPWLAVGDAALAVDPISGSGVPRALRTAEAAANTVASLLDRPEETNSLITRYEAARDHECTRYLMERAHYYGIVHRFGSPFWNRRVNRPAS